MEPVDYFSLSYQQKEDYNIKVAPDVVFYCDSLRIGRNVRIDHGVIITGNVTIGSHVHLAPGVCLYGSAGIEIGNFAGLSGRVSVYSTSDDYSDGYLTNPTVPDKFRKVKAEKVTIGPHAIIGAHSVILPGVTIGEGASVGALSLVNKSVPDFLIVHGNPIRKMGRRLAMPLRDYEKQILESLEKGCK